MAHSRKRIENKICKICGESNQDCLKKDPKAVGGVRSICYSCDARRQRIRINGTDTLPYKDRPMVCKICGTSTNLTTYNGKERRLCKQCAAAGMQQRRKNNPEYHKQIRDKARQKLRNDIVEHYGSACAVCGEAETEYLQIDHINNDGKKHREEKGMSGVYTDIRQRNYPKDEFQLLCANCHFIKSKGLNPKDYKNKRNT